MFAAHSSSCRLQEWRGGGWERLQASGSVASGFKLAPFGLGDDWLGVLVGRRSQPPWLLDQGSHRTRGADRKGKVV